MHAEPGSEVRGRGPEQEPVEPGAERRVGPGTSAPRSGAPKGRDRGPEDVQRDGGVGCPSGKPYAAYVAVAGLLVALAIFCVAVVALAPAGAKSGSAKTTPAQGTKSQAQAAQASPSSAASDASQLARDVVTATAPAFTAITAIVAAYFGIRASTLATDRIAKTSTNRDT